MDPPSLTLTAFQALYDRLNPDEKEAFQRRNAPYFLTVLCTGRYTHGFVSQGRTLDEAAENLIEQLQQHGSAISRFDVPDIIKQLEARNYDYIDFALSHTMTFVISRDWRSVTGEKMKYNDLRFELSRETVPSTCLKNDFFI